MLLIAKFKPEVPEFADLIPTAENIAVVIHPKLKKFYLPTKI